MKPFILKLMFLFLLSYSGISYSLDTWNYKVVKIQKGFEVNQLNEDGREGWELVQILDLGAYFELVYKQPNLPPY